MAYVKPQSPMQMNGETFYPLTTIDQIIKQDGNRLSDNDLEHKLNMDLLWTNSTPLSEFAAQTITVNASNYPYLYIIYIIDNSALSDFFTTFIPNVSKNFVLDSVINGSAGGHTRIKSRWFFIDGNSFQFLNGYDCISYNSPNLYNRASVPYQIYGVK